jgi:hypothetical protein
MISSTKKKALALSIMFSTQIDTIAMDMIGQNENQNAPESLLTTSEITKTIILSLEGLETGRLACKISALNKKFYVMINGSPFWEILNKREGIPESRLAHKDTFFDFYLPVKVRLSITCILPSLYMGDIPVLIETSTDKRFNKYISQGRNDLLGQNELFPLYRKDLPLTIKCNTAYHLEHMAGYGHMEIMPTKEFRISINDLQDSLKRPLQSIRLFYDLRNPNFNELSRFKMNLNYEQK